MIEKTDIITGDEISIQIMTSWESYDIKPELKQIYSYYTKTRFIDVQKVIAEIKRLRYEVTTPFPQDDEKAIDLYFKLRSELAHLENVLGQKGDPSWIEKA